MACADSVEEILSRSKRQQLDDCLGFVGIKSKMNILLEFLFCMDALLEPSELTAHEEIPGMKQYQLEKAEKDVRNIASAIYIGMMAALRYELRELLVKQNGNLRKVLGEGAPDTFEKIEQLIETAVRSSREKLTALLDAELQIMPDTPTGSHIGFHTKGIEQLAFSIMQKWGFQVEMDADKQ